MCMIMCSEFYSHFVCFTLLSVFSSIAFRSIAFSLTRSDTSAGNNLSVPQYTAVDLPVFILTDACFLFCVFAVYCKINDDDDVYEPDYGSTVRGKDIELLDSEWCSLLL